MEPFSWKLGDRLVVNGHRALPFVGSNPEFVALRTMQIITFTQHVIDIFHSLFLHINLRFMYVGFCKFQASFLPHTSQCKSQSKSEAAQSISLKQNETHWFNSYIQALP